MLQHENSNHERKFHVYKRELNGFVHRIGTVMCVNKVQADTKVRMMYAKTLLQGETIWAVDPELDTADKVA